MAEEGHDRFWQLAEDFLARPGCTKSTMMGYPCLRRDGTFFACVHRDGSALIVKMSRADVKRVVDAGDAQPFAPNGRVFREWAAIPLDLSPSWAERMQEAWVFAGGAT